MTSTELRLAEERASATETRFAALVENVGDIIAVLDTDGVDPVRQPGDGTHPRLRRGRARRHRTCSRSSTPTTLPPACSISAQPDEQGIGTPVELRLHAADGSWRHLEVVVTDLTDNPAIGGLVLNARDVTERVEAAHALAAKAFTDALTGLPNRMRLLDRLGQALADLTDDGNGGRAAASTSTSSRPSTTATAGRWATRCSARSPTGCATRSATTPRRPACAATSSRSCVRDTDSGEVVRLANRVARGAQRTDRGRRPSGHGDGQHRRRVRRPGPGDRELLGEADHALIHAKERGGDRAEVYGAELAEKATRRKAVEQQLRHALDNDSISVHYQPIVDIETDLAVGAEALLRVHDDEGALLSPAEFIEAAESSGLITRLGSQVLQSTCEQLAAWSADGGPAGVEQLSVNISPRQLADPDLPQQVRTALNAAGVPPERLCLEITESILIGPRPRSTPPSPTCGRWACASASTTSAPASRRSATSSASRSTS